MPVQDASESDSDSDAQEYEDGEALYYESIAPGLSLRASLYCSWPDRMRRAIASYASQGTLSFVQTACVDWVYYVTTYTALEEPRIDFYYYRT